MEKVDLDVNGKESSKRKQGKKLINVSIAMASLYVVAGIGKAIAGQAFNYSFPTEIWYAIIGTGVSLIGATLFEKKV